MDSKVFAADGNLGAASVLPLLTAFKERDGFLGEQLRLSHSVHRLKGQFLARATPCPQLV